MLKHLKSLTTIPLIFLTLLAHANVNTHFKQLHQQPKQLFQFLKNMPKGGELHYHLAGGAYPQVMLQLAKKNTGFCLNNDDKSVYQAKNTCLTPTSQLSQATIYQQYLNAWSMQNLNAQTPKEGHDHFFATFLKFMPIVVHYRAELLKDILQRAAHQHEQYLELMVLPDNAASTQFAPKTLNWHDLEKHRLALLANPAFQTNVSKTLNNSQHFYNKARKLLGCNKQPTLAACQIEVKFQYYVLREQPIEGVFAQALNGFEAANRKGRLVAVNLVQPEDGSISMRDYGQQMQLFSFFHKAYPNVPISLHAGELTKQFVPQTDLASHIHDAIHIGQANRIGHGVDIVSEQNSKALLAHMKQQQIAVEINLSSNAAILGVSGKEHPLRHYLTHGVPVVLSTDDEGILQTNLTQQYFLAATQYHLDYDTLKQINRNALTFSFLAGKSLWQHWNRSQRVKPCLDLNSRTCQLFVAQNPKAAQQRLLELALTVFESQFSPA